MRGAAAVALFLVLAAACSRPATVTLGGRATVHYTAGVDGKVTVCRPTINGQYYCQDQTEAPGLVNPRAIRDGLKPAK